MQHVTIFFFILIPIVKTGNLIGTVYGVKNKPVEPDDIKWSAGIDVTYESDYTEITIKGLKINAPGNINTDLK